MLRQGTTFAALAAVSVALAACGGSDSKSQKAAPSSTTPAPVAASPPPQSSATPKPKSKPKKAPSKASYIRRADQICKTARSRLLPLRAKIIAAAKGSDPNLIFKRYADLTGQAASTYSNVLGQLRGLDTPPADQAQIDMMNQLVAQIAAAESQISSAAAAHDAKRIQTLNVGVTRATEAYRSAAKAYGFRECGAVAGGQLNRRGNR